MHKVIVLGAGRVGRLIVRDLSEDESLEVTVADRRAELLDEVGGKLGCATACDDLGDVDTVARLAGEHDLVVDALPGAMGLDAMRGVVRAGKPAVDISFMEEDPRCLDEEAKASGARILYDFGVAPGMSNLLCAASALELGAPRQIRVLVGGLPVVRRKPWEYAAPFSPADVIEEYIRPARIKVHGRIVERQALSGLEHVEFPELGTLEAFYTDGLRSLLDTIDCPSMEEKTLRYPGYADRMLLLRDSGFLDDDPIALNGIEVIPRDVTLKLLEPVWFLDERMDDFTVMRLQIVSGESSPYKRIRWNLLDYPDRARGESSMSRTTGFPAALAARRMLDGALKLEPGVHPPEQAAGNSEFVERLLKDLESRGVVYRKEQR
jgi:lysine 6-dehydrogenase